MAFWRDIIEKDKKTKEKEVEKEVKEEIITPAIETPTPIRHEPIIYKDTLTEKEIKSYIDKRIKAMPVIHRKPVIRTESLTEKEIKTIRELLEKETVKEIKIEIDADKVFLKMRSLDPELEENAVYLSAITRTRTGRRSWCDRYVSLINKYFNELKKEA